VRDAWLLSAIVRLAEPTSAPEMTELRIALDVLTSAERRDLANALLRAAWSAVLEETRILLLDLLLEAHDPMPTDSGPPDITTSETSA
jgi:hypothetical protein